MTDGAVCAECSTVCLDRNSKENTSGYCEMCDKQKMKCQKALDELKSAQSNTELLRAEVNISNGACGICAQEESKDNKSVSNETDLCVENSDLNNVLMNLTGNTVDEALLDVELDKSALQELHSMAVRPWVRQMLLTAVIKLEQRLVIRKKFHICGCSWE
jgi:hypothetical protein